jgi:hypothetical protein
MLPLYLLPKYISPIRSLTHKRLLLNTEIWLDKIGCFLFLDKPI